MRCGLRCRPLACSSMCLLLCDHFWIASPKSLLGQTFNCSCARRVKKSLDGYLNWHSPGKTPLSDTKSPTKEDKCCKRIPGSILAMPPKGRNPLSFSRKFG